MSHTPGPWLVWEPESEFGQDCPATNIIIGRDTPDMMQEVAYVNCRSDFFADTTPVPVPSELVRESHWCTAPAEAMANARLIAAAPDLLICCQLLLNDMIYFAKNGLSANRTDIRERAEAAIAKATGETP